jgi:hypothetical protein
MQCIGRRPGVLLPKLAPLVGIHFLRLPLDVVRKRRP